MKGCLVSIAVLVLGSVAVAQDQSKIDQAIHKGIEYLKGAGSPPHEHSKATHSDELLLYTFIIAEVSPANPRFKALLDRVTTDEPYQVYKVALQGNVLQDVVTSAGAIFPNLTFGPRIAQALKVLELTAAEGN